MLTSLFIMFWVMLFVLVIASIHFVREAIAKEKLAKQYPYRRYDPDEPVGQLKYCDDYHAGMFYW